MIYAKNITPEQRKALKDYENICGFEPLYQDELNDGSMTFSQVWNANINWLEDVLSDVVNIRIPVEDEQ